MRTHADPDARRDTGPPDGETDSLGLLREQRTRKQPEADVQDEETFELPGFEVLDDELTVPVTPMSADEFRCDSCFLIFNTARQAHGRGQGQICLDCAEL